MEVNPYLVSDSSPIIIFARSNNLSILKAVVGCLIIPRAVYAEVVEEGKGFRETEEIKKASWIKVGYVEASEEMDALPRNLGGGEKEAIILAKKLNIPILLDDLRTRKEAKRQGLKVVGSLSIIYIAKRKGLISSAKELLDLLIESGYYLSNTLYYTFLKEMGELNQ